MQVVKWGNRLAVPLPSAVVYALGPKDGDHIEIRIARERVSEVSRDQSKTHALDGGKTWIKHWEIDFTRRTTK